MHRSTGTLPQLPWKGVVGLLLVSVCTLPVLAPVAHAESLESLRGPDVTIIAQEEKTIFEFRQAGELRMVKVVPKWGKPYYLVPRDRTKGFGDLERAEMLLPPECKLMAGNLREPVSLDAAMRDVDAVYLSLANVMSGARPMAYETCAAAITGASFMPSPTMATRLPDSVSAFR